MIDQVSVPRATFDRMLRALSYWSAEAAREVLAEVQAALSAPTAAPDRCTCTLKDIDDNCPDHGERTAAPGIPVAEVEALADELDPHWNPHAAHKLRDLITKYKVKP